MSTPEMEDITVSSEITINAKTSELYKTWREIRYFPAIFDFLESVIKTDKNNFRCTALVKDRQERLSWDIEITEEKLDKYFLWHSFANTDLLFEGSANFNSKGLNITEIRIHLKFYFPLLDESQPYMLGIDFKDRINDNLRRFKLAWEAGEFPQLKENLNELPDGINATQSIKKSFITEPKKGDSRKNKPQPPH